jgi:hypothetical protein
MKKNKFTQFSALLAVLFVALFFSGCSDSSDDGGGSPELPADVKEELKNIGLENFPLPSGGVYDSCERDEDDNQLFIYWKGTTRDIFDAYKEELEKVFVAADVTANNYDAYGMIGWKWTNVEIEEIEEIIIFYNTREFTANGKTYAAGQLRLKLEFAGE